MTQAINGKSKATESDSIKFLYSYGGKIIPRPIDGKLRYVGGFTRVLSVDRNITYSELMVKFGELSGLSTILKCKLPNEDLDLLVTIKSDDELANLIEEYERASSLDGKIRAVLFPVESAKYKKISPPSSPMSCFDFPMHRVKSTRSCVAPLRFSPPVVGFPVRYGCVDRRNPMLYYHGAPQRTTSS